MSFILARSCRRLMLLKAYKPFWTNANRNGKITKVVQGIIMTQHQPWETLSFQQVLDTPYLKIRCEQVAVPNGPVISDYYIIENRGWVGVVPFTEDGRFLINNQYKHGIGHEVLEFPAGGIDAHEEDPVITARRELMEETGY